MQAVPRCKALCRLLLLALLCMHPTYLGASGCGHVPSACSCLHASALLHAMQMTHSRTHTCACTGGDNNPAAYEAGGATFFHEFCHMSGGRCAACACMHACLHSASHSPCGLSGEGERIARMRACVRAKKPVHACMRAWLVQTGQGRVRRAAGPQRRGAHCSEARGDAAKQPLWGGPAAAAGNQRLTNSVATIMCVARCTVAWLDKSFWHDPPPPLPTQRPCRAVSMRSNALCPFLHSFPPGLPGLPAGLEHPFPDLSGPCTDGDGIADTPVMKSE